MSSSSSNKVIHFDLADGDLQLKNLLVERSYMETVREQLATDMLALKRSIRAFPDVLIVDADENCKVFMPMPEMTRRTICSYVADQKDMYEDLQKVKQETSNIDKYTVSDTCLLCDVDFLVSLQDQDWLVACSDCTSLTAHAPCIRDACGEEMSSWECPVCKLKDTLALFQYHPVHHRPQVNDIITQQPAHSRSFTRVSGPNSTTQVNITSHVMYGMQLRSSAFHCVILRHQLHAYIASLTDYSRDIEQSATAIRNLLLPNDDADDDDNIPQLLVSTFDHQNVISRKARAAVYDLQRQMGQLSMKGECLLCSESMYENVDSFRLDYVCEKCMIIFAHTRCIESRVEGIQRCPFCRHATNF
jgi:hypothetical protein